MNLERELYCRGFEEGGHESQLDARFTLKGTTATYAPDRVFDMEHIRLEVEVDIKNRRLYGRALLHLRAITNGSAELHFDAVGFRLREVKSNGVKVAYKYDNRKISITPKKPFQADEKFLVEIAYHVTNPPLGLYFIRPDKKYPKKPVQVWTQGEDEYARYWFPCFDHPVDRTTTEVLATVPSGFTAVSNGSLIKTIQNRRKKQTTFHWSQTIPHATYLVTLAVGKFSVIKDHWRQVPVTYYCEKGLEADAKRAFGKTPRMIDFFSKHIGVNYPYAKYAQVAAHDFIYGGMENTSATTQTEYALLDERSTLDYSSDELVAHELAHQWFGDYLTCRDWSHAWLNESFATYFDALFKRFDKGEDEYLYQMRTNAQEYFAEDKGRYRRAIVTDFFRRPSDLFDRHLYEKGSVVLRMLHHELGEDLFWKSIKTYVTDNRGKTVQTSDLMRAIEKATGRNMKRFFDQWVFGPGHPEYKIRHWWDEGKKKIFIRVVQTNAQSGKENLFFVKTDISFLTKQGEKVFSVTLEKKSSLFDFTLKEAPLAIIFDPDHVILMKADFAKSELEWLNQLERSKNILGRIEAAHALSAIRSVDAVEGLRQALLKDSFWGVQSSAAYALGSVQTEASANILIHSLDVISHPKVRRAIYGALKSSQGKGFAEEVADRYKTEASYFAWAEGLTTLCTLHHPKAGEHVKAALKLDSWNDVIRSAAVEGLAALKSPSDIPTIISYTKSGHHPRLRMTAIRSLAAFGRSDDRVQPALLSLTKDSFVLVRNAAVRMLTTLADERAVPALKKLTTGDLDGRLLRLSEEAIEAITKGFES